MLSNGTEIMCPVAKILSSGGEVLRSDAESTEKIDGMVIVHRHSR